MRNTTKDDVMITNNTIPQSQVTCYNLKPPVSSLDQVPSLVVTQDVQMVTRL